MYDTLQVWQWKRQDLQLYNLCPIRHKIVKLQEIISVTKVYGLVICKFTEIIT